MMPPATAFRDDLSRGYPTDDFLGSAASKPNAGANLWPKDPLPA